MANGPATSMVIDTASLKVCSLFVLNATLFEPLSIIAKSSRYYQLLTPPLVPADERELEAEE